MKDILFEQNYIQVADICTIIMTTINMVLLNTSYTIKKKSLGLFSMANTSVFIAAVCSIIYHSTLSGIYSKNAILTYIFRDICYIGLVSSFVILCEYIAVISDMEKKKKKNMEIAVSIIFITYSILEIISPVTKIGFYIDGDMKIHENYYLNFFILVYIIYVIEIGYLLYTNRRKFITRILECMVIIITMSLAVMFGQVIVMQNTYNALTFVFPIMAMLFLFHYNAYDIDTGSLDYKSFDSYIREMKNKKFSMVCIGLQYMDENKLKNLFEYFLHFNEKFFKRPCIFRLRDNKFIVVYKDELNPDAEEEIKDLLQDFMNLYKKYRIDYKVSIIHSNPRIMDGSDYISLSGYLDDNMGVNDVKFCTDEDIESYLRMRYIVDELSDINFRQNLDDSRVKVYCQPVYNAQNGITTSAEALMRLELDGLEMVYPDVFIHLAEKYDYIHTLSKIILNKTCKYIKSLENTEYDIDRISVNFSISELRNPAFLNEIMEIISENEISYDKIAIELTESTNDTDYANVKKIMSDLSEVGVKFYLDDFGTGYSNIGRIMDLPIDIIKFDRSLTIMARRDENSRFMVGSFSHIFQKSNYKILFEGIEDEVDEELCKEMNASYLQGYKYSKPVPIEKLKDFL